MGIFENTHISGNFLLIILVNLGFAITLIAALRIIAGMICSINATDELAKRDNPAFGIALAGVALAVTIMLTGILSGRSSNTLMEEFIVVGAYGLLGLILMGVTRFVFDRISMPRTSIRDEILRGNIAAGILDAGNVIATAVIVRQVMLWVNSNSMEGMKLVLIAYIISQCLLTLVTFYRVKTYALTNQGKHIETTFQEGNIARSLSFSGYRIGVAFAITSASGIVMYEPGQLWKLTWHWAAAASIMVVIMSLLTIIAGRFILAKIPVVEEIDQQKNIAIGILEAVIYVSMGILLSVLLAG